MSGLELGERFYSEGPHRTPVQQGFTHLGLHRADFQNKRGGRPIIPLRAEPFEAWHETDPSVDFEREVSVFVDRTAKV